MPTINRYPEVIINAGQQKLFENPARHIKPIMIYPLYMQNMETPIITKNKSIIVQSCDNPLCV